MSQPPASSGFVTINRGFHTHCSISPAQNHRSVLAAWLLPEGPSSGWVGRLIEWASKERHCHWRSSWRSRGRDVFYLHISIFSGKLVIKPSVLRGCPVQDGHIWTCPFGPSQLLLRPYTRSLMLRQCHLRVLLRLEKPIPTQVISTLSPPLSSSPHGLVSILNITWKKLFKCRKNSIV